jgi:hypothetical protein
VVALPYLCGAARKKSITYAAKRTVEGARRVDLGDEEPAASAPSGEDVLDAHRLDERARKLFPVGYLWYLRHRLFGETHAEIARDARRSPETVRQKVREIGLALAESKPVRAGLVLMLFIVLFVGVPWSRFTVGVSRDGAMEAKSAAPAVPPPPASAAPTDEEALKAICGVDLAARCGRARSSFFVLS